MKLEETAMIELSVGLANKVGVLGEGYSKEFELIL